MTSTSPSNAGMRARWSAIGAAIALCFGAGGFGLAQATVDSGDKPITITIDPVRVLDTRTDVGLPGPFASQVPQDIKITGSIPTATGKKIVVPTGATGVFVNATPVNASADGFISLRPATATGAPSTSNLNFEAQKINPNGVLVELPIGGADDGKIEITYNAFGSTGPTSDVLVDVFGYTIDHNHDDRYYTASEVDAGYVSAKEDTFYYVPGSLLEIHFDDGPATVYFDNSSDAIVRKTGSPGYMQVILPVPLPAELGGDWGKLVNLRVSYKVDNTNSYIDDTWLTKSNNSGGHVDVAQSSVDRKSTAYTSYVVDCNGPGCQLAWVPNGNYLTVGLGLRYGGIGDPHDITIGGVLLRVSYDG